MVKVHNLKLYSILTQKVQDQNTATKAVLLGFSYHPIQQYAQNLGQWDFKPAITQQIITSFKIREVVDVQVIQQPYGTLRNYPNPLQSTLIIQQ